jgi:hypothetical protein
VVHAVVIGIIPIAIVAAAAAAAAGQQQVDRYMYPNHIFGLRMKQVSYEEYPRALHKAREQKVGCRLPYLWLTV